MRQWHRFHFPKPLHRLRHAGSGANGRGSGIRSDKDSCPSLAGVGRKTANVIRGNIYHDPSIVVDTHVKRIVKKLGITKETEPEKVEFDLMKKLPKDHWILCNIHLITFGREICKAPTPKCEECFLCDVCADYEARMKKQQKDKKQ